MKIDLDRVLTNLDGGHAMTSCRHPHPLQCFPPKSRWSPRRLNRNAIHPDSRLGLSEPQPRALQPSSRTRPTATCSAVSMHRPGFLTPSHHQHDACMSRPDAGAARPRGTAITPLHSPEIVGQIFRDLSATEALSAPPNLGRSGSAASASTPARPSLPACSPLATCDRPYPRFVHIRRG